MSRAVRAMQEFATLCFRRTRQNCRYVRYIFANSFVSVVRSNGFAAKVCQIIVRRSSLCTFATQGIESPLNPFSSCDRRAHSISKSCDSASARYAFCTQWNQQVSGRSPRKILKCEFREHIASYSEGERSARKLFNRVEQHARALLHTRIFESSRLLLAGPHVSDGNTQRTKMFAKIVRNEKIN
jgi:hypothetical protein